MSFLSSIYGSAIGGAIAGVVGLLSAYVSRHLDRRERHLSDHKANFRLVRSVLPELMSVVWPIRQSAEEMWLGNHLVPTSHVSVEYGVLGEVVTPPRWGNEPPELLKVDKILYYDMKNHFSSLFSALEQFNLGVKSKGIKLSVLLSEISNRIYSEMYESDFQVLAWTYNKNIKNLLRNLKGRGEEQEYAGSIFLFIIEEPEENWPNRIARLKQYNLYGGLKNIAETLKEEVKDEVAEMKELLANLRSKQGKCEELIADELRRGKLRGNCEFI